jgi:hypothetical protein
MAGPGGQDAKYPETYLHVLQTLPEEIGYPRPPDNLLAMQKIAAFWYHSLMIARLNLLRTPESRHNKAQAISILP